MPFYMIQELDPNEACDDIAVAGGLDWWCVGFYLLSASLVSFTLIGEAVDAKLASCRSDKDRKSRR